ncbi:MAG TPA: hypothetical protein VKP58_03980 [Candidatus Acidoferrum sp.]|nr:hypothetical protein [Candidatus Acidoferrum sp.]
MMRLAAGLRAAVFCGLLVCGLGGGSAMEKQGEKRHVQVRTTDDQEYLDESNDSMVKQGFTEMELGREIKRFGNVATVLSSYEGKVQSTGKVVTRGVNIFSLYFDGQRWWIQTMLWDEEGPGNPIPANLLPRPR